jgi:hypothetical protein
MRDGERRATPAQAVTLELERANRRRGGRERIEGAEQVAGESRLDELAALDGSTGRALGLQHQHLPTPLGEHVRRHQAVVARTDHDRVEVRWHDRPIPAAGPPKRFRADGRG